jgi:hypothetical protein
MSPVAGPLALSSAAQTGRARGGVRAVAQMTISASLLLFLRTRRPLPSLGSARLTGFRSFGGRP